MTTEISLDFTFKFTIKEKTDIIRTQILEDKGRKNISMVCGGEGSCGVPTITESIKDLTSLMAEQVLQESGTVVFSKWSASGYSRSIRKKPVD